MKQFTVWIKSNFTVEAKDEADALDKALDLLDQQIQEGEVEYNIEDTPPNTEFFDACDREGDQ